MVAGLQYRYCVYKNAHRYSYFSVPFLRAAKRGRGRRREFRNTFTVLLSLLATGPVKLNSRFQKSTPFRVVISVSSFYLWPASRLLSDDSYRRTYRPLRKRHFEIVRKVWVHRPMVS